MNAANLDALDWETVSKRLREVESLIATGAELIADARAKLQNAVETGLDPAKGRRTIRTLEIVQLLYGEEQERLQKVLRRLTH